MGIVFRQSIKSSIVIFLGALLGTLLNYIYPFTLSKIEFGFFTTIIYTGALLQIIAMMGTGSLLAVFIQKYPSDDERRKILITIGLIVTILGSVLLSAILLLFKNRIISFYHEHDQPYMREFYNWIPVLILFWAFMSLFDHYLISQIKIAKSSFTREVLLRILNFVLIGLLFYKLIGFKYFIIGSILVHLVPVLILLSISAKTEGFGFSTNFKAFTRQEYKEIIHFSWYHVLLVVSLNVMGFIDTIMLGLFDKNGMESMAPYRIAIMVVTLMVIPYRAMSGASYATLNQAYIDNDSPKLKDLFTRSGINIFIVAMGMFVLITANIDNIVAILPAGYEIVKPLIIILMLGKLADMGTGLNNELISISKYYKFNFRVAILLVLMVIGFNYLLIPRYSVYGAAWGATLALAVFNLLKVIFLWYKLRLHPFNKKTILVIIAGVCSGLAGYYLPFVLNVFTDVACRSLLVILIYSTVLIVSKTSADLNAYLENVRTTRKLY